MKLLQIIADEERNKPGFYYDSGLPGGSAVKKPLSQEDPLQYSCLGNPMDRGA